MDIPFETGNPPTREEPAEQPLPVPEGEPKATVSDGSGFRCYICEEPSLEICIRCTRDSCDNHLCEKCRQCSDCCRCEDRPI